MVSDLIRRRNSLRQIILTAMIGDDYVRSSFRSDAPAMVRNLRFVFRLQRGISAVVFGVGSRKDGTPGSCQKRIDTYPDCPFAF